MPVRYQDGSSVPMAPSVLAGRVNELLDLTLG